MCLDLFVLGSWYLGIYSVFVFRVWFCVFSTAFFRFIVRSIAVFYFLLGLSDVLLLLCVDVLYLVCFSVYLYFKFLK